MKKPKIVESYTHSEPPLASVGSGPARMLAADEEAHFYVTILNDSRLRYARGPFPSREAAERAVNETRVLAAEKDPWSCFYGWGVSRIVLPWYEGAPAGPMNRFFAEGR